MDVEEYVANKKIGNEAEVEIYKKAIKLLREYHSKEKIWTIANVDLNKAQIDLLIIKRNAIIIVDFKNIPSKKGEEVEIIGNENGDWKIKKDEKTESLGKNYLHQIKREYYALVDVLTKKIHRFKNMLEESRLRNERWSLHVLDILCFNDGIKYDYNQLNDSSIKTWFKVIPISELPSVVERYDSDQYMLTDEEISNIIELFNAERYKPSRNFEEEIENVWKEISKFDRYKIIGSELYHYKETLNELCEEIPNENLQLKAKCMHARALIIDNLKRAMYPLLPDSDDVMRVVDFDEIEHYAMIKRVADALRDLIEVYKTFYPGYKGYYNRNLVLDILTYASYLGKHLYDVEEDFGLSELSLQLDVLVRSSVKQWIENGDVSYEDLYEIFKKSETPLFIRKIYKDDENGKTEKLALFGNFLISLAYVLREKYPLDLDVQIGSIFYTGDESLIIWEIENTLSNPEFTKKNNIFTFTDFVNIVENKVVGIDIFEDVFYAVDKDCFKDMLSNIRKKNPSLLPDYEYCYYLADYYHNVYGEKKTEEIKKCLEEAYEDCIKNFDKCPKDRIADISSTLAYYYWVLYNSTNKPEFYQRVKKYAEIATKNSEYLDDLIIYAVVLEVGYTKVKDESVSKEDVINAYKKLLDKKEFYRDSYWIGIHRYILFLKKIEDYETLYDVAKTFIIEFSNALLEEKREAWIKSIPVFQWGKKPQMLETTPLSLIWPSSEERKKVLFELIKEFISASFRLNKQDDMFYTLKYILEKSLKELKDYIYDVEELLDFIKNEAYIKYGKNLSAEEISSAIEKEYAEKRKEKRVMLKDVILSKEVKERINDIIEDIREGQSRSVLLYGPPGTGKTLLARAISNELEFEFVELHPADYLQKYVGETEQTIKEIFDDAIKKGKVVIFIDEFESIAFSREYAERVWEISMVNQLMTSLQDIKEKSTKPVVVIAATNYIDKIDKAVIRRGRFDDIIKIPLPDDDVRLELFKYYIDKFNNEVNKHKIDIKSIDFKELVKYSEGCSGADIESIIMVDLPRLLRKNQNITTEDIVEIIKNKCGKGKKEELRKWSSYFW